MGYDLSQLCLVPVGCQHAEAIFLHFTAEVARYMEAVPLKSRAEAAKIIRQWQKGAKDNAVFAIECQGSFLGLVSLHHLQTAPEAGLWLKREVQGRRCGSQAFSALLRYADHLGIAALRYPVDIRNTSSRRIALSFGGKRIQAPQAVSTEDRRTLYLEVYLIPCSKYNTAAD
ncbi:MAG: GNAT family N-acetyltransferase [Christensenellales bacterium]